MTDGKQFATFSLNGLFFGIEVLKVQEVIRYQEMTRVPLAPRMIEGLINLRGQIVTAIDLRRRLEMPPRPAGELPMNVVISSDDGAVSLLVDELIRGVYKLKERLLLILDTEKAVGLPTSAAQAQKAVK
jgi:purine-binding chemotaxis protein CheW